MFIWLSLFYVSSAMCDCWDAVDGWVWGAVGRVGLGVGMDQGRRWGCLALNCASMWGGPVVHITLESGIWHAIQLVIRSQNADAPPCTYSMQLRCPSCNWLICCRCLPIWNVTPFFSLCESKRHISALFTRTWNGILKLSKHVPAPVDRRSSTP